MGTGTGTSYLKGTGIKIANNRINADSAKAIWDAGSIGNYPVDTTQTLTTANKGQVLKWNGTKWAAGNDSSIYASGGGIKYKFGKELVYTKSDSTLSAKSDSAMWNANKIINHTVDSAGIGNGKVLKYNAILKQFVFADDNAVAGSVTKPAIDNLTIDTTNIGQLRVKLASLDSTYIKTGNISLGNLNVSGTKTYGLVLKVQNGKLDYGTDNI